MDLWSNWTPAHWWVLGLICLSLEMLAPAAVFLWFGVAGLLVGTTAWLIPSMGWQEETLLFTALALGSLIYLRAWRARNTPLSVVDQPYLNKRTDAMVGQTHALLHAIENGRGKIQIGDAQWRCTGPDLPAGTQVQIDAVRDLVLHVTPV